MHQLNRGLPNPWRNGRVHRPAAHAIVVASVIVRITFPLMTAIVAFVVRPDIRYAALPGAVVVKRLCRLKLPPTIATPAHGFCHPSWAGCSPPLEKPA